MKEGGKVRDEFGSRTRRRSIERDYAAASMRKVEKKKVRKE